MEDFNIVPSTGTFGNAMGVVNQNFELAKEQIDKVSKMKENSLGMFASRENLVSAYPSPQKGQFAYVGNSEPFAIYKCVTDGEWPSTSSGTWDGGTIDLNDFATKETTDTLFANMKYFSVPQSAFNNGVITLTIEDYKLFVGGAIKLKMGFVLSSGVGVKMNINNTGEKALYYNGSNTSSINSWKQNEIIEVFYDGEKFMAYKLFDRKILDSISDSLSESFDVSTIGAVVNFVNTKLSGGYLYAGIATPSSTPTTGKVFYLALTSGTYTNFGNIAVTQGINILKYNGSVWSLDAFVGIDDTPTPQSNELVKSGGVFNDIMTNGSAFNLTAYNNGTTYEDLNAALTALNALPAAYKKGGMSMKFVRTYDNKYVQARLMADSFTTDVTQWQSVDTTPAYDSPNLVESGGVKSKLDAITSDGNLGISSLHFVSGYYNEHGVLISSETRVSCTELIKGGNLYFITNNTNNRKLQIVFYDINKQYVTRAWFSNLTQINAAQYPYFRIGIEGVNTTTVYNETIKLFSYANQGSLFDAVDNINILREWNGLPEFIHAAEDVFDNPYFSDHRVVFKSGQYLFVRKGETIGLRDYTNHSVWLRYKKTDGTIVNVQGWRNQDYVAPEDGYFRVAIKENNEGFTENLADFASLLFVDRIDYLREQNSFVIPAKFNFLRKATLTIANHAQTNMEHVTPNTAFATQLAVLSGYSCIENDVRKTLDGVYVLGHNDDISTYYNNSDGTEITPNTVFISQTNYATLVSDYIAKDGFSHITTLEEQLEICKSNNIHLICEPKLESSGDALEIVELCRSYLGYENFALAGFSETMLDGVRTADKIVTLLYIACQSSYKPNISKLAQSQGNSFVYVDWESVTAPDDQYDYVSYLAEAVSKGVPIGVWTINFYDAIRVAKEYKFKAITSNFCIDTPKGKVDKQYLGISNSFANSDEVVITGGTVVGKTLHMPIGAKIEVTYPAEVLGNVEFEMVFSGKLSITDSWGITNYGSTEYDGGSYKFATQVGPLYSTDGRWPVKFTFEATADTVISVFNFTARRVL